MEVEHRICPERSVMWPGVEDIEVECDLYELHGGPHWDPWFGEWE